MNPGSSHRSVFAEFATVYVPFASVAPLTPVPLRLTDCGLPGALSAMLTEAVRVPAAAGLNSTPTEQVEFTATEALLQVLLESTKSDGSVPVRETVVMLSVADPVFFTVMVCAALVVPTD